MSNTEDVAEPDDELCDEYDFDYSQSKRNRFADRVDQGQVVVVLDEDIARVFQTPDSVNAVLRALIATMPTVAES